MHDVSGLDAWIHPSQLSLSLTSLKSFLDPEGILELISPVSSAHCIENTEGSQNKLVRERVRNLLRRVESI